MLKDYQIKIIDLMAQMELSISELYELFAEKFPKYENLWIELSKQEVQHADWVKQLQSMAGENRVFFDEKLTKSYSVQKVLEIIKATYANAKDDKLTLINALSVSRDLEQSVLEREFYNYFTGRDAEVKMIINNIRKETIDHQTKLRNAWEEERKIVLNLQGKQ